MHSALAVRPWRENAGVISCYTVAQGGGAYGGGDEYGRPQQTGYGADSTRFRGMTRCAVGRTAKCISQFLP